MDDQNIESGISLTALPGYDLDSGPFGRILPVCDRKNCCHYGEGCALGYPVEWEWIEHDRDLFAEKHKQEIMLIYSLEFKDFWYNAKGVKNEFPNFLSDEFKSVGKSENMRAGRPGQTCLILTCAHQGCSFDRCNLLKDEAMMSSTYKAIYLSPSFGLVKKKEEAERLQKYNAEKERFYEALEKTSRLVCPNCQVVPDYKVFMPAADKRGEIICRKCGRSIAVLNHL